MVISFLRVEGLLVGTVGDDLAKDLAVPTPMSSQTANLYRILNSKGHGELDGIAVLKLFDGKDNV